MADALVIKGLSKRFGGLRAVQDVSFHRAGERDAGADRPERRRQDHELSSRSPAFTGPMPARSWRSAAKSSACKPHDICALGLARTFQVAKPFGAMTVLANVMTGAFLRDRQSPARARKALRSHRVRRPSPRREQTAAKDLTTIDQRRLEMARALATQPKILLLDEVMAGLNPSEIDQAVALVEKALRRAG